MKFLQLSGNHLRDLPDDIFWQLHSLEELDLSDNKLNFLPHNLFDHLTGLKKLKLSENSLEILPQGINAFPILKIESIYNKQF